MRPVPLRITWFPVVLILAGVIMLLNRLHVFWEGWPAFLFAVVAVAGAAKLYNGFLLRSRARVFWGFFWLSAGGALALRAADAVYFAPSDVVAGICLAAGIGLALVVIVAPRDWYVLVPALSLLLLGSAILATEVGYLEEWDVVPVIHRWWPAALILFGAAMIAAGRRRGSGVFSGPPASSFPTPPRQ